MSIVNVPRSDVIVAAAQELKKVNEIKPPTWALFAKTGSQAERPPINPDWWYIRTASILAKIHALGPIGVSKLRTKYGGKRNRGMAPERFKKSGGKIIRLILQQLEKAGFSKQATKGIHKGRIITPQGTAFIEKIAYQLMKEQNIVLPKKNVPQPHEKPTEQPKTETQPPTEEKPKKQRAPRKPKKVEETPPTNG